MSLKRKLSSDHISQTSSKRFAPTPTNLLPSTPRLSPAMDSTYFQSYPPQEDYLSCEMFTSQPPQDFGSQIPVATTTGVCLENMPAYDTTALETNIAWGEPQDIFAPALTPSRESDSSSASSENLSAMLDSTYPPQDPTSYDTQFAMVAQAPAAFPVKNQWTNVAMDSPVSVPSTYDDAAVQEAQMLSLDMGQVAYDPGMSHFENYVSPVSMVHQGVVDQPYSPMDPVNVYQQGSYDVTGRRLSNESSPRDARSDPRYRVRPRADGLYHCPFDGCDHQPDKLKCNYDKHLDAHLRPYRCIREGCRSIQFSSTACVLRHEREAHGMHGHGHKPYTCKFPDCERANPEHGFPRKWNLKDHMKRVHHFDEEAAQKTAASPLTPPESPNMHVPGPQRTKRGGHASPKPRNSKEDTIKASSQRKSSRMPASQVWPEPMAPISDMHQGIKYEQNWSDCYPQQWMPGV